MFSVETFSPAARRTALALYVLALIIRLWGFTSAEVQPDEIHWRERSRKVVHNIEERRFSSLTSHLGQPGLVPAVFMAVGQGVLPVFTKLDRMESCRLINIILSALIAPLIYLGGRLVFGEFEAILAALLMLADPVHIGLSRMAHLDSMLTLLVSCSVLLYAHGQRRRWPLLTLLAGVFWGLSISTKPTAAALVPAFVIYRLYRKVRYREEDFKILSWLDVWAVIIGHVTFALIYTRLWEHPSQYAWRLNLHLPFADKLYELGSVFGSSFLIFVFAAALLGSAYSLVTRPHALRRPAFHMLMGMLVCSLLLTLLALFPAVFENIVRYWGWTAGLSSMRHEAYGLQSPPSKWGYLGLYASRLPPYVLFGLVLAIPALRRRRRETDEEIIPFSVLFIALAVVWTALLSVSSKQAFRYVMPVMPGLMLLSAFGLVWFTKLLGALIFKKGEPVLMVLLALMPLATAVAVQPYNLLYFNSITGGVKGAKARGSNLAFNGVDESVLFLREEAQRLGRTLDVSVFGDGEIVRYVLHKHFPDKEDRLLNIRYAGFPGPGSYMLRFGPFLDEPLPAGSPEHLEAYAAEYDGVRLVEVLQFPIGDYAAPLEIPLVSANRLTGERKRVRVKGAETVVVAANPVQSEKGFLVSNLSAGFRPGRYLVEFDVMPLGDAVLPSASDRPAIRLDVGKNCQKTVTHREVLDSSGWIGVFCTFSSELRPQLRAYWFGSFPLSLSKVRISKAD